MDPAPRRTGRLSGFMGTLALAGVLLGWGIATHQSKVIGGVLAGLALVLVLFLLVQGFSRPGTRRHQ